jgi:hypothetical protein
MIGTVRSWRRGPPALVSYAGTIVFWLFVTIGVGMAAGCGPPTALVAVLFWIDVVLLIPALVALWWTVTWLATAARNEDLIRRWFLTGVAVAGLGAYLWMVLVTVFLFLAVYAPLNCPD